MSDNPTRDEAQLRAYENAFKLVRRTLGLPDESPDDGADLRRRLPVVAELEDENVRLKAELETEKRLRRELKTIVNSGVSDLSAFADVMIEDRRRLQAEVTRLESEALTLRQHAADVGERTSLAVDALLEFIENGRPSDYAPWRECDKKQMADLITAALLVGPAGAVAEGGHDES